MDHRRQKGRRTKTIRMLFVRRIRPLCLVGVVAIHSSGLFVCILLPSSGRFQRRNLLAWVSAITLRVAVVGCRERRTATRLSQSVDSYSSYRCLPFSKLKDVLYRKTAFPHKRKSSISHCRVSSNTLRCKHGKSHLCLSGYTTNRNYDFALCCHSVFDHICARCGSVSV